MENNQYKLNDIVEMKKEHPCKERSKQFKILGIDGEIRLKCVSCGAIVLLKRSVFNKACKKVVLEA